MKLQTGVSLPEYPFRLDHHTPVMLMGSCFTGNIGKQLERYLFPVTINPFGTIYNPLSVIRCLDALLEKEAYEAADLQQHNGLWFSFDHYTGFSSPDREQCLHHINTVFRPAREVLHNAGILVITWGTAWVYRYRDPEQVVCNCHKIPASEFIRTRLTTKEIIKAHEAFLPRLFEINPDLKILLTVSPVRHWKDGARGNQLSKASLLLATEALEAIFPENVFYFPSYEIVMDELRDYRFYREDMLHTNDTATAYIWEKFREVLVSPASQEIIRELEPIIRLFEHRPPDAEGDKYLQLIKRKKEMLADYKKRFPFLPWESLHAD
ncbi:MAG: GSCFA domain-containing protein [Bacteroidota bacterium]